MVQDTAGTTAGTVEGMAVVLKAEVLVHRRRHHVAFLAALHVDFH